MHSAIPPDPVWSHAKQSMWHSPQVTTVVSGNQPSLHVHGPGLPDANSASTKQPVQSLAVEPPVQDMQFPWQLIQFDTSGLPNLGSTHSQAEPEPPLNAASVKLVQSLQSLIPASLHSVHNAWHSTHAGTEESRYLCTPHVHSPGRPATADAPGEHTSQSMLVIPVAVHSAQNAWHDEQFPTSGSGPNPTLHLQQSGVVPVHFSAFVEQVKQSLSPGPEHDAHFELQAAQSPSSLIGVLTA
jgi:hypothetical protein